MTDLVGTADRASSTAKGLAQGTAKGTAKATSTTGFSADVLSESARQPVLVLFLSPQSEACRALLGPLQRAVAAADGKVKLATLDIDAHPQIPSRLGIRAVPAVYAFQRGQPIDGFMGPLPEAQIKGFIERLVGPLDDGLDDLLAEGEAALAAGDPAGAADAFGAVLQTDPEHLAGIGGLARALVAGGDLEAAREVLAQVPPPGATDKAIVAAQAALDVAAQASEVGDLADLTKRLEANPDDHQARFDLAIGLNGAGKRSEAADALIELMKRDRNWNEGAAKKQLLQFFEAWGLMDKTTLAARRKLSTLLFS
jgi:putative thioredoxin